ncbi:MAG: hypothetical protein EXR79_14970 [Myxococcales bacterium]|nr:hypothetical protein [Myxococcales bacterium]
MERKTTRPGQVLPPRAVVGFATLRPRCLRRRRATAPASSCRPSSARSSSCRRRRSRSRPCRRRCHSRTRSCSSSTWRRRTA